MRGIRMAALAAVLVMGAGSVAAAQAPQPQPQAQGQKHGKHGRAGGDRGREGRGDGVLRGALRGVQLSDAQKTQLATITEKYRGERQAFQRSMRESHQASGERPDSAARAAFRAQMQQLSQRQHAEIRAILTAEQQKTFDENVAKMKARGEKRMEHRRGERSGRR